MTQAEYDAVSGELMALAGQIETDKRPGYTIGSADVLANFKRVAERAGISTEQAWTVYFLKHVDAIVALMTRPDLPVSEAAPGRFADAVNYLRLGFGILREREPLPNLGTFLPDVGMPLDADTSAQVSTTPAPNVLATAEGYVEVGHGAGYGVTLADAAKMGPRR